MTARTGFAAHWAGWRARFDGLALRAPAQAQPDDPAVPSKLWGSLQRWADEGAGPGGAPFWRPGAATAVPNRFALARWQGRDIVVEAWARQLDGSTALLAMGAGAQRRLRLGLKWREAGWWRQRSPGDPWDAGHLIDSAEAATQLQHHFLPRRPTLLIAGEMNPERLASSIDALQQRADTFRHPVRLLCLSAAPLPPRLSRNLTRLLPGR